MKTLSTTTALRILLLLAAILPFTKANAYDFVEEYNQCSIQYTITSDTTVGVTGCSLINENWADIECYDIEIPRHVNFNNITYTVTAICDSAFNGCTEVSTHSKEIIHCITIPETILSIGSMAFGNCNLNYVISLGITPPEMRHDSFGTDNPNLELFVLADAYSLYKEMNDTIHLFQYIHITNGERAVGPSCSIEYLDYPDDLNQFFDWNIGPYGCVVRFSANENSIVYSTGFEVMNYSGTSGDVGFGFSNEDYLEYRSTWMGLNTTFVFFAYTIEEGKSPSCIVSGAESCEPQWSMPFDFKESGIAYYIKNHNEVEVTYSVYGIPCGEESPFVTTNGCFIGDCLWVYYSGDIIIPNQVNKHNIDDTYSTYSVTSIGDAAFSIDDETITIECLHSVTLPSSITLIGEQAFGNSPNLTFIKCFGSIPPLASDNSFDDGVYQNTILFVPMDAVETYREAEGWRHFQNIVGFYTYDYVVDGIYYTITGDGDVIVVHGDNPYQGIVNIPTSVTYEGVTYNVTGISSGAFADATLQSLILPVTIASVEDGAFDGCHINSLIITGNGAWTAGAIAGEIDNLYVMSSVTDIEGLQVNPSKIYSYSNVPSTCNDNTFTGYDGALHVPASSLAAYFTAPYWSNFINIVGDAVEPTGIKLNNDSIEVLVGNQLSLNATITPSNAVPRDVIWTTSDESIATVNDGAITALKAGECDIKAYLLDKTATCHVTVTEITPTEVTLNQEFAKLEIGSQLTLTATVLPDNATDKQVTWSTTNSAVATVDSLGHVTAVGDGECFITATCRDKQAMCHVIVVDHFIYITLDEHDVRLMPNHMMTLTPTVSPANTTLVVTSSDPTVAAARMANGNIQLVGIKEGTTVITVNSTDGFAEADSCLVKVYTLRGDVNSDGFINISDVTALINRLFSGPSSSISEENADANNDGKITIADVTALINSLLSGEPLPPKDEPIEDNLTFTVNGVTFTMVAVEGGTFTMGATPEQGDDALDGEKPAHQVTLSDYAIGQTEVTQVLWVAVMGTNPSRFKDRPENPVELVDWNDCQAFITQLNQLTGRQFRLPTEAEWEYAARGGNKSQGYKYAGSNNVDEVAWYSDNCNSTQPVGTKKANELGIYDMSGNVWEWCQDYYGSYSSAAQTNPTGPATGTDRIRRGVGWNGSSSSGRVSHRSSREQTYKYNSQGLRLAL